MNHLLVIALHSTTTTTGISLAGAAGVSLAVVCSWTRNRSVLWAFLAGILSYFYVIYWIMTREDNERRL
jgi:hypothetical protein